MDHMQKCSIDCVKWKHSESSPVGVSMVGTDATGVLISYASMHSGTSCYDE
jgi:hypothetical protein